MLHSATHSARVSEENPTVLVTGASGFLGQHLVQLLSERGVKLRALYHKNAPDDALKNMPNVVWQCCDLLDVFAVEEAMQGITEVYHCAAIVSFHPGQKEKMMHFNIESTAHIVNEALAQNIRKLVFVSSVAALGRSAERQKEITEEAQWEESRYNSRYGLSKHLAEMEVWRAAGEGLNTAIVNPGIILGEPLFSFTGKSRKQAWDEGSARLMNVVNKEFPFYTQGINGWVDVKDVVKAMVQLMESPVSHERFIVTAGNFSYKEVFTGMAKALHKKPPHIRAGKFLTGVVWRWSMLKSKLLGASVSVTKETARTARKQAFYNNEKLKRALPEFEYTDLKTTIERMAKAFRKDHPK